MENQVAKQMEYEMEASRMFTILQVGCEGFRVFSKHMEHQINNKTGNEG